MNQLSIVIPHSGRPSLLKELLLRLESQSVPALEIIVVCNGPRHSSEYQSEGTGRRRTIYIDSPPGANAARNVGWRMSRGEWVLFLDDDCLPLDSQFLGQLQRAIEQFKAPFGGHYILSEGASLLERAYFQVQMDWLTSHSIKGRAYHLLGGIMCFPRKVLLEYPFDDGWKFGGTELEQQVRLYQDAVQLREVPELLVQHNCKLGFKSFFLKAFRQGVGSRAALLGREQPPQFERHSSDLETKKNNRNIIWLIRVYHFAFKAGSRYFDETHDKALRPWKITLVLAKQILSSLKELAVGKIKTVFLVLSLRRNQILHETWQRWRNKDSHRK